MGIFTKEKIKTESPIIPDSQKVNIGLLGVGKMGQYHARLLASNPHLKFLGVSDLNEPMALEVARKYKTSFYKNLNDFPSAIQAVVIATPTPSHYLLAKEFLKKGIHCFVEKPLTEEVKEAEEIIEIAQKKNLVLQVGHIERFNPAVIEMTKHAKDPLFIEASRLGPYDNRVSHVGVVLDLMIHDIDIVLALVRDKVIKLDAVGGKVLSNHEDIVKVTLHFSRGCRADISASRVSLKNFRKIRVFQKDAYMSLDYSDKSLKIYKKKKEKIKSLMDISYKKPHLVKHNPLEVELTHFSRCIKEGKAPLVGGQHGRDALEIAFEIRKMLHLHSL